MSERKSHTNPEERVKDDRRMDVIIEIEISQRMKLQRDRTKDRTEIERERTMTSSG